VGVPVCVGLPARVIRSRTAVLVPVTTYEAPRLPHSHDPRMGASASAATVCLITGAF
jgi:hypothetical protein